MVRVSRRPLRSLPILVATATALALVPTSCKCPPCCPELPEGEPLVQGTMRIDPVGQTAELTIQIGGRGPIGPPREYDFDLWVGPDPDIKTGLGDAPSTWSQVPEWKSFHASCTPWTNPPHARVWSIEGEDVTDVLVAVRIRPDLGSGLATFPWYVFKYFEVPESCHAWSFTAPLYASQAQAVIGGKPGTDNSPMIGVGLVPVDNQPGPPTIQQVFTFTGAELQAPVHGWRPKRVWFWRIPGTNPPAWDDRTMHVDDAFWSADWIPPLPAPVPTRLNPVIDANLTCEAGVSYWIYAIVEESDGTETRFHAHRSAIPRASTPTDPLPHAILISPDADTTTNGPVGS